MKNKRLLSMLLCMALAVSCLAGMTVSASADDVVAYTVKNGDYLYKVCKNNGLDYYTCKSAIMILNGWSTETQCNRIIPGQTIILPVSNAVAATVKASATSTSSKTESVTINGVTYSSSTTSTISTAANSGDSIAYYLVAYTVKSGDYIAKICSDLGTSYTAYKSIINNVNGLSNTKIYAGKVLYIPVSTAPSSGSFYAVMAHRVDTGETMSTICSSYSASASSALTKGVNDSINLNSLKEGQVVYIPVPSSVVVTPTPTSSDSGSGSGIVSGTYSINFTSAQHGDAYAMVDSAEATGAESGDTVFIVTEGDSGYAQKSISVIRTDTKATVPVEYNCFTMPASDVKITVTYAASKSITKMKTTNGSFSVFVNGIEGQTAAYGSKVFLEFAPNAGYAVSKVEYTKASESNFVEVKSDSDGDYYFNMPNYNIKIKVTFAKASYYNITPAKTITNGTISYTVDDVALSSSYPKAAKGATVVAVVKPNDGYGIKDISATCNGKKITLTEVDDNQYSFKMPEGDVKFDVELWRVQVYEVAQKSYGGGTLTFYAKRENKYGTVVNEFTNYFYPEEKVYIKPVADNYADANVKYFYEVSAIVVKQSVGNISIAVQTDAEGMYFEMPADWVTVESAWKQSTNETYRIYDSDLINASYKCYVNGDPNNYEIHSAAPGTIVKIVITTPASYGINYLEVIRVKSAGGYESLSYTYVSENTFTFVMPKDNVAIRISADTSSYKTKEMSVTKELNYIDADSGEDVTSAVTALNPNPGTLKVLSSGTDVSGSTYKVREGTQVEIVMSNLKSGYEIDKVTATVNGLTKEIKADSEGRYYYTIQRSECDYGTIKFSVQIKAYTYEVMYSSPANGSYTINGFGKAVKAYAGETITIAGITPKAGYEFNKVIVDDTDETVNVSGGSYKFTMPAWDVKTQVTFKQS